MQKRLTIFAVFSLFLLITMPAYANVTSLSLEKSFYTTEENFKFVGKQEGSNIVFVVIRDLSGDFKGMLSAPSQAEGEFDVIPRPVDNFFTSKGIYNATAFTDSQKEEEGFTIQLEFDGEKVFEVSDFVLTLNSITDKTIEEKKTLSFTASLTESVTGAVFSLEKNPPTGASIDSNTGKFTFTPTESQAPGTYVFDIVVTKGAQIDRETIKITVTAKAEPEPVKQAEPEPVKQAEPEPVKQAEPEPLDIPAPFVDKTKDPQSYVDRYNNEASYKEWFDANYPEYSSIYQAVGLDEPLDIPAPFVDKTKDPQSYVDRYNNEASYKEWFDANYPEYSSIYQAVGLDEPKKPAPFVDPKLGPQYYIDRYNNESEYREWFDKTYPDLTIYEAVGVDEPIVTEPDFGECGPGTQLIDGTCTLIQSEGGGCLIATAAYGSEMSSQVQFLREIRDSKVMTTSAGTSFMAAFNKFYYSFSPSVADYERENPLFREMVKIGITPMLSTLSVMSFADSEQEILGYGVGVILMNLGMYVGAPIGMIYGIKKYRRARF